MPDPKFECVIAQDQSSFRCVRRACTDFEAEHPWHFHPAFELTWIMRSHGTRYIGDSVERYEPGDLVLVGPNLPHCWRNDACGLGSATPEWIIAQFDPACLGAGFLDLAEASGISRLLWEAQSGIAFGAEAVSTIGPLFNDVVQRSGMARLIGLIDLLDRLSRFPRNMLADRGYHESNQVDQDLVERLNWVQLYIGENLTAEISQSMIADQLGMSASAFSKFFRAATGRTFMSMVKLLRINEACRLLSIDAMRITDGHFPAFTSTPRISISTFANLKVCRRANIGASSKRLIAGRPGRSSTSTSGTRKLSARNPETGMYPLGGNNFSHSSIEFGVVECRAQLAVKVTTIS
jgi:AraC-like DNA-binding protein